jgi:hypothetical protein
LERRNETPTLYTSGETGNGSYYEIRPPLKIGFTNQPANQPTFSPKTSAAAKKSLTEHASRHYGAAGGVFLT